MTPFETWWLYEGSAPPLPGYDIEEHCKRMCEIAWKNGAFKEREVVTDSLRKQAQLAVDEFDRRWALEMVAAINARSNT
jgi:hypothetical protein